MQRRPWLRAEAAECLRVFGYVVRQEFERDKAIEFCVLSFVHHTHATAAKNVNDAIMGDGPADRRVTCFLRVFIFCSAGGRAIAQRLL